MQAIDADEAAVIASVTVEQHVRIVAESCEGLTEFLAPVDFEAFAADDLLVPASEMLFVRIGAALRSLTWKVPDLAEQVHNKGPLIELFEALREDYREDRRAICGSTGRSWYRSFGGRSVTC